MKKFYLLIFLILVVLVDQISKNFIQNYMLNNFSEIEIFPFLKLTLVYNSGIAFGMLNELGKLMPTIFAFIAILIALLILIWSIYNKKYYIVMGLIAGGAVGNALDRFRNQAVVDFIDIYWKNYHWPTFNIADISISLGVFFFIYAEFFNRKEIK